MELRNVASVIGFVAAGMLLAGGCGGTLEGKYRRGQLTTTSTGPTAGTGTNSGTNPTVPATATTTTTTPPVGNAAGQAAQGEASGPEAAGTISGSATRRTVVSPSGGRHR